jgi:hypothetical protein
MITVEINPARIERIVLNGRSQLERELDDAAYRVVRPLINQMDRRLRALARESLKGDD